MNEEQIREMLSEEQVTPANAGEIMKAMKELGPKTARIILSDAAADEIDCVKHLWQELEDDTKLKPFMMDMMVSMGYNRETLEDAVEKLADIVVENEKEE